MQHDPMDNFVKSMLSTKNFQNPIVNKSCPSCTNSLQKSLKPSATKNDKTNNFSSVITHHYEKKKSQTAGPPSQRKRKPRSTARHTHTHTHRTDTIAPRILFSPSARSFHGGNTARAIPSGSSSDSAIESRVRCGRMKYSRVYLR